MHSYVTGKQTFDETFSFNGRSNFASSARGMWLVLSASLLTAGQVAFYVSSGVLLPEKPGVSVHAAYGTNAPRPQFLRPATPDPLAAAGLI